MSCSIKLAMHKVNYSPYRQLNYHLAHVLVILPLSEVPEVYIGLGTVPIYIRS